DPAVALLVLPPTHGAASADPEQVGSSDVQIAHGESIVRVTSPRARYVAHMEGRAAWEAEQPELLSGVQFPVFAVEGLPVELGGWGGGDGDPVDSVSLRHEVDASRRIEVDSEFEADEVDFADMVAERIEDHAGADVESVTKPIRVDGVQRRFAFASGGGRWVAVGRVGDVTVAVDAVGFDPTQVHLRALTDPTQVSGGRPQYRPQRPAFDVMDPRRIAEHAESTPVPAVGRRLAAAAKRAIALVVTNRPSPSWLGGEPELPAGAGW